MKRSHSTAELPVFRPVAPVASDDIAPAAASAAAEPTPVPPAEPNAAEHAPMAFPGPFAYVLKPAAMQDSVMESGSTNSALSGRDGSRETVVSSGSLAAAHGQSHSEPAPAASKSSTAAAGPAIAHATAVDDNPHGFPPLMLAAVKGRLAEVKLLLEDPAVDIDQVHQKSGGTALIAASCTNKPEVVACLLARGAKVNFASGENRRTALMQASSLGHVEVVKALVARQDIALDATDTKECSALFVAVCANRPEVVACLLTAGAKVELVCGRFRRTALMEAASCGYVEVVKALLTRENVALDLTVADGFNALALAAGRNHPDVVKCLLAAGAAVNLACGPLRQTALGDAAYAGYVEVVKTLLASPQVAIDATNVYGQSPLHVAARFGKADVAACLLEAGASRTILTAGEDTALELAIEKKHAAVVEVLLQPGADVPDLAFIDPDDEPSAVAFAVTVADLVADLKSPAEAEGNPLGLIAPDRLDDPVAVIDRVIEWLAKFKDLLPRGFLYDDDLPDERDQVTRALQRKLYKDGIRAACLVPVGECLASFLEVWPLFTDKEGKTNEKQMQLVCAAALGRLSAMTANGAALRHYKAAGISAEGIARLSAVATQQIDRLIALSEELLTTAGSDMLEGLMPACLFRTGLENAVDTETLTVELCKARWLKPLAQTIVTSWEAALAALGAEPVPIPAGSTLKQITQLLSEHVKREAPLRFKQALQKELAAHTLLAAKRTWQEKTWGKKRWDSHEPKPVIKMLTHDGVELLFQIQCDQLRQYCEQTGRAD